MLIPKIYQSYVISPILIKDKWLYHRFSPYYLDRYLKRGIVPRINRHSMSIDNNGYNGLFHVSLAKNDPNAYDSSYNKYIYNNWAFIVNPNIKVSETENIFSKGKKASKIEMTNYFWNTIFGILGKRYSCYDDEYHKFSKIKPKDFIAIKITENEEDFDRHIENIFDILEEYNIEIPVIDNIHGISISRR